MENLKEFVDFCGFGAHKRVRTTSALLRTPAHIPANGRTLKKCSFWNLKIWKLKTFLGLTWSNTERYRNFCSQRLISIAICGSACTRSSSRYDKSLAQRKHFERRDDERGFRGSTSPQTWTWSPNCRHLIYIPVCVNFVFSFGTVTIFHICMYHIISLCKFVIKERRARVEALRRKMSNQASTEAPKEPISGFSAS